MITLHEGDCREVLATLEAGSIDACCTDPPYHLTSIVKRFGSETAAPAKGGVYARSSAGFMGQQWDGGDVAFRHETWAEVLRVLKPGAHLLAFGGTRTYHRLACAIEDAGFEIRDKILWHYGSGFPKSHDVSKGIDRAAGAERDVVSKRTINNNRFATSGDGKAQEQYRKFEGNANITAPATDAAKQWAGWGTALKPSTEILVWATKPLKTADELTIMGSELVRLWSRLWLLLPANAAEENLRLSPSVYGVDPSASARWSAAQRSNTRDGFSGRMDTLQFVQALISSLNTVSSWSVTLAEFSAHESTSTTETESSTTTDWKTLKSCLLKITPEAIIQAHSLGLWSTAHAEPAARYFNANVLKWRSILELSALEVASTKAAIFSQEEAELSPNTKIICLARKPLGEATVASNVLRHGTGALNIDGCRVETTDSLGGGDQSTATKVKTEGWDRPWMQNPAAKAAHADRVNANVAKAEAAGRWPANVAHDGSDEVLEAFARFGESKPHHPGTVRRGGERFGGGQSDGRKVNAPFDTGTAARFFFCGKATKEERGEGNSHPTIKPLALMRWLCRLITPPGGTILDPFLGSGSTALAADQEGFHCIGIDLSAEYLEIARRRLAADAPLFANVS